MQLNFFNTIELSGPPLVEATEQASKQDDRVMKIFKKMGCKLTPFQVSEIYNKLYPECPVTSIRRSLTVLTTKGFLTMCDEMKIERYNKPNHYWKINH